MEITRLVSPEDPAVDVVARNMQATLEEVLGALEGEHMYSLDWLRDRVRGHVVAREIVGAVFVARADAEVLGHVILREETGYWPGTFGLFSTVYVGQSARREGLGERFIKVGESWIGEHGLKIARTVTDRDNDKLIKLFGKCGYALGEAPRSSMVSLSRELQSETMG